MNNNDKIKALRAQMAQNGIDAYIIFSSDPHQSEYLADYYSSRSWISGFTGSAGTAIITQDHAGLWTDSRYFLQAEQELSSGPFVLQKLQVQTQAEYLDWCIENLNTGQVVGCDFWCLSYAQLMSFRTKLSDAGINLLDSGDLLNEIWIDRPSLPTNLIYEHESKFACQTRSEKINLVRNEMSKNGVELLLVSALDEIAWVLNLRGSDVSCNPVFLSYLIITPNQLKLFVDKEKLDDSILNKLKNDQIEIQEYSAILQELSALQSGKVWFDPSSTNARLGLCVIPGKMYLSPSPIMLIKSRKTKEEIAHIRKAMEQDAVALTRAFMWLEEKLQKSNYPTEYEFAKQIQKQRSCIEGYIGESFDAIVGYQDNGAIIHYRPDIQKSKTILPEGVLLVDSGGQYVNGTTDITRTIALSEVSEAIKKKYTAVLKGHIALSRMNFPQGTKGIQLDVLARQFLWQQFANYGHGTGHGVGYFMNVHEPPQGFVSAWNQRGSTELEEGMLTSNEPGYYQTGKYGIRIENLIVVRKIEESGIDGYFNFETLTLFPIDISLIYLPEMDRVSLDWLNQYHKQVYARVSPYLNAEERDWLNSKCKTIE